MRSAAGSARRAPTSTSSRSTPTAATEGFIAPLPRRRAQLSQGLRVLGWALVVSPALLLIAGVAVLLAGGPPAVGVALLGVSLLLAATPIALVVRALSAPRAQEPPAHHEDEGGPPPDS